jgi:hypothetical protein
MMIKTIESLKNIHLDEDIYVIASGASMDYVHPSFFDGKITIGINQVYKKYTCTYLIRKEVNLIKNSLDSGSKVIVSEFDSGNLYGGSQKLNTNKIKHPNLYYFEHPNNEHKKINTDIITKDGNKLVVSFSTVTTAIHLAAYLGAFNIILCGHDAGVLDGKMHFEGYSDGLEVTPWKSWNQYRQWLRVIETQTVAVKNKLEEVYGINVLSMNPFVNFGLEGHKYER